MSQELTFKEVAEHSSKKDLYLIVHDKVYNTTSFVDEHPGGEEVLLDVGGQDATEAFEDVGHSDEARELLEGLLVGKLKRVDGDPAPTKASTDHISAGPKPDSGANITLYAAVIGGGVLAYLAYVYMNSSDHQKI